MTMTSNLEQGLIAYEKGNYVIAAHLLEEARKNAPRDPMLLSKLGNALKRSGRFEEAASIHEQLVERYPHAPEALSELAATFLVWGKTEQALHHFEKAVSLCPTSAELHYNLAVAKQQADNMESAEQSYRTALALDPSHAKAWSNLGICLKALNKTDEAIRCQRRAVELAPDDADLQWNLSLTELLVEDFKIGFERYEWRRKIQGFFNPGGIPWNGERAPDRTLTIYAEQGLGDAIQFARYIRAARERVGRIRFMCRKEMTLLMKEDFRDANEIIPMNSLRVNDLSVPLMSLPHVLALPSPFPETVPYLHADVKRVTYWTPLLRFDTAINVGFAWQGNPAHRDDRHRSMSIHNLIPILNLREARFFSLQKEHGLRDLGRILSALNIVDLGSVLDEEGAFVDTAAVMRCMDIVLTVDTSIAHLSGALGVETWTMLPFCPDFRWGQGACSFYPTMRLFRQERRNDWSHVIEAVRNALLDRCRSKAGDA